MLHDLRSLWIDLPLRLPPTTVELRQQALTLLQKQQLLPTPAEIARQEEILREDGLELSGYLRPIGADGGGYPATEALFYLVLDLCEEVGLRYKARYDVPRPSVIEPRLRSFLPNPPHASYPSNHSFQSFSIAFVFSRLLPEHPGVTDLFRSARRIAENREWAGIHYPGDTEAGHDLARMFLPVLERVCAEQMLAAQAEWL